jgi:c-di-GMP-binding flagellar brake protein YcgR
MSRMSRFEWGSWRRHRRVIPDAQAPVTVRVDEDELPAVTGVRDISEGGLELDLAAALPEAALGRELSLRIDFPEPVSAGIALRGAIRHIEEGRIGVVFIQLDEQSARHIRRYVEQRASGESWLARLRRHWLGR